MKSGNTGSLKLDVTTKKYRSLSERFNGFDKFERQCIVNYSFRTTRIMKITAFFGLSTNVLRDTWGHVFIM